MKTKHTQNIRRMVSMAILIAIVIILQAAIAIPLGPFTITLTLVPIIIGAIIYGPVAGAILGGIFGIVVCIQVVTGAAGLYSFMMFEYSPVLTLAICIIKGAAAGLVSGLIYKLLAAKQHNKLGVILSAIACPIVNTAIFAIALLAFYGNLTTTWAMENSYASVFTFIIMFMIGLNFVVEFAINVLLIPAVLTIIKAVKRQISR
ncbi:MAG: ECF transporter S component [Clostridia bacterium]|nr:ECF transporter S component [Clostridia bacterium]